MQQRVTTSGFESASLKIIRKFANHWRQQLDLCEEPQLPRNMPELVAE